jgi:hypothetical protein
MAKIEGLAGNRQGNAQAGGCGAASAGDLNLDLALYGNLSI